MTPYLSSLLADLSDGALVSIYIIGVCAVAGIGAGVVVYGWPALMDWFLPRLARWHSRQIRRANVAQPFPPDPVEWAPLLVVLPLVASRGYTSRTLTRKIKRIRWGAPRPEWSSDTVTGDCFVIELEAL